MISRLELLQAIDECEQEPVTFQSCEKLATLYTVYDHLFADKTETKITAEKVIDKWGESDFLKTVAGKEAGEVWGLIDELVSSVQVLMPRLYEALLVKLQNG